MTDDRQLTIADVGAMPEGDFYLLPIDQIDVGARRREDYGDLSGLAAKLRREGKMLHPVVVDNKHRLIAGHRRLCAWASLGEVDVMVHNYGEVSDERLRQLELEENRDRKDLTPYEESKEMVARVEAKKEEAKAESASKSASSPKNPKGGRPEKADATHKAAAAAGTSERQAQRAKEHVETAEAYPFMQSADWSQNGVLEARKLFESLTADERQAVAEMVGERGVPALLGLQMIRKVAAATTQERADFMRLYRSSDDREQSDAVTWAAERAPEPDPRLPELRTAMSKARWCVKKYPNDPEAAGLNRAIGLMEEAERSIVRRGKEKAGVPVAD